ncbi:hypothetical protein BKA62DRAFT_406885 [Auriculariales sp. MPI-PUGE-AT-0066]|nr:hypothetical protein BKA62DRAFT_406885 [Auriculariales sp. MPI-PUGE-AT-0066]
MIWWQVFKNNDLDGKLRTAAIVAGSVYSAMALAALLGLIGAISRSRPLVAIYSTVLYVVIAVFTAAGTYFVIQLYRDEDGLKGSCNNEANKIVTDAQGKINGASPVDVNVNINTSDVCDGIFKTAKWTFIVSLVVSFLIQMYCAYIVSQYVRQLSEEQSYHAAQNNWSGTAPAASYGNVPTQSYYAHQPLGQQQESLLHPTTGYPYSDKSHSFGNTHQQV